MPDYASQAWTKEPTASRQLLGFAKENPVTTILSVATVALELSPYGPTGFLLRLRGSMKRKREEEAAKWDIVEFEVPTGAEAGSVVPVSRHGVSFTAIVPDGKKAGDKFKVKFRKAEK